MWINGSEALIHVIILRSEVTYSLIYVDIPLLSIDPNRRLIPQPYTTHNDMSFSFYRYILVKCDWPITNTNKQANVMFSQVSVCSQRGGGLHGMHAPPLNPQACTPPGTPPVDTTRCAQWAGGTHPTGMHSCFFCIYEWIRPTFIFWIRSNC